MNNLFFSFTSNCASTDVKTTVKKMEYDLVMVEDETISWSYGVEGEVMQITKDEFLSWLSSYTPNKMVYCQIQDTERLKDYGGRIHPYMMLSATIFIFWDFSIVMGDRLSRFWKVAKCLHDDVEIGIKRLNELQPNKQNYIGNCSHYYECQKCHRVKYIDSSG